MNFMKYFNCVAIAYAILAECDAFTSVIGARKTFGRNLTSYSRVVDYRPKPTMLLSNRSTVFVDVSSAPVHKITSTEDYYDAISSNPNKLVVFKWFAPWCRSCRAMDLKYKRLAIEHPDVLFYDIDVSENKELKKLHGINAVPAVHMYAGQHGMVENFMCGPSKVPILAGRISKYANIDAFLMRSKGGLMEKLSAFSSDVASIIPYPSGATISSSKGLMEKFALLTERVISGGDQSEMVKLNMQ